jgi:hypothetical protein
MSKTLFRINDIVIYCTSINNYCKVLGIIDENETIHSEYEVITRCGDKNSKVKIIIEIIAEEASHNFVLSEFKPPFKRIIVNPHDIHLRDPYEMIEKTNKSIENLNNRIDFFNKHKNPIDVREEKLSKLIK